MAWYDFLAPVASGLGSFFGVHSANNANRNIARETNVANAAIADRSNAFSAQQAQNQMDFQERMANTSWQRGTADMKAAGINPMLAFSQGGASSPSGSAASASQIAAQTGATQQDSIGAGISSAMEALTTRAAIANTNANTKNTEANTKKLNSLQPVNDLEGDLAGLVKHGIQKAGSLIKQGKSLWSTATASTYRRQAAARKTYGKWNKKTGEIYGYKSRR